MTGWGLKHTGIGDGSRSVARLLAGFGYGFLVTALTREDGTRDESVRTDEFIWDTSWKANPYYLLYKSLAPAGEKSQGLGQRLECSPTYLPIRKLLLKQLGGQIADDDIPPGGAKFMGPNPNIPDNMDKTAWKKYPKNYSDIFHKDFNKYMIWTYDQFFEDSAGRAAKPPPCPLFGDYELYGNTGYGEKIPLFYNRR